MYAMFEAASTAFDDAEFVNVRHHMRIDSPSLLVLICVFMLP